MRMARNVFSFLLLFASLVAVGVDLDDVVPDPIVHIVTSHSNENVITYRPLQHTPAHTLSNENVIICGQSVYATAHTESNQLVHNALWCDIIEL